MRAKHPAARLLPSRAALRAAADALAPAYGPAEPFPHAVFDGLFDARLLERVVKEFPRPSADPRVWTRWDGPHQRKLQGTETRAWGPYTRRLMRYLNTRPFLDFLQNLTGIEGLIADPLYGGGGLHQIERGGFLHVHADFNKHEIVDLDRRLNVLIYLNQDWPERYGGKLQLWDRRMKACRREIAPVFNRTVVFSTDSTAFHGHPEPLRCPAGRTRKSLALYYYTDGRPGARRRHGTLFQETGARA